MHYTKSTGRKQELVYNLSRILHDLIKKSAIQRQAQFKLKAPKKEDVLKRK